MAHFPPFVSPTRSPSSPTLVPVQTSKDLFIGAASALFGKYIEKLPPAVTPVLQGPTLLPPASGYNPLQTEVDRLTQTITSLDQNLGRLKGENDQLQSQLEANALEKNDLDQRYAALTAETAGLRANIHQLENEAPRMRNELNQLHAELQQNEQTRQSLQTQLNDANQQLAALTAQEGANQNVISALRQQIQVLDAQIDQNAQTRQQLDQRCAHLTAEVDRLQSQVAQFEAQAPPTGC